MQVKTVRFLIGALLAAGIVATGTLASRAAVPPTMNFQAILLDSEGGTAANGDYELIFRIYDTEASGTGTVLWDETQMVTTSLGLFNTALGVTDPVPDSAFSGPNRWFEIQLVGNALPYVPRTKIGSVAYAYRVSSVDGALGGSILSKVSIGPSNTNTGINAFVVGSGSNVSGSHASISGGQNNIASGDWSTIGGGTLNLVDDYGCTVGGGQWDTASGDWATTSGGVSNGAHGSQSTIAGGAANHASGDQSTISGGSYNEASAMHATIPGGYDNDAAGIASFAAGTRAKANHDGSFVWGDNTVADVASTGANQFIVRSSGGIWLGSNSSPSIPAGDFLNTSTGAHLTTGGLWTNNSDAASKENFSSLDGADLLERVAALPIMRWNYKAEDDAVTHIGPTAQHFHALFGVGNDDKSISTLDPSGVALAAIQQLYRMTLELQSKDQRVEQLEKDLAALRIEINRLSEQK